jgi:hypothetical protein
MRNRIFGGLSLVGAALWPLLWEFVRSLFYERGSHMLTPFINSITMDQIVHWGPTVGLSFLGLWLFWKTAPEKKTTGGDQVNIRGVPLPTWQFDSKMAYEIAARLRSQPEWQDKIIVDVTPEYLWNLFRGNTSIQGNNLAQPFLNKWMIVCGPLGDVSPLLPNAKQIMVTFRFRFNNLRDVHMYFNESCLPDLETIMQGNNIAVVGIIDTVTGSYLQLKECKLVQ